MSTPTRPDAPPPRSGGGASELPAEWRDQLRGDRPGRSGPRDGDPGGPGGPTAGDPGDPEGRGGRMGRNRLPVGRTGRGRRWLVRAAIAVAAAIAVVAVALGALLLATPSTSDAQRRVAARAAAEHTPQLGTAMPTKVIAALVATEDSRFYSHSGVDLAGAFRGTIGSAFSGGDQGGATLDQQLVKILYTGGRRSFPDRIEQVALALKLDHDFSKTAILRMYLNTVYFGHGYYGIVAAAAGYFGRTPTGLSWTQASMLAGLVQAPSAYDPVAHLAAARTRQAHVLYRLVATHVLTPAQRTAVAAQPLGLR